MLRAVLLVAVALPGATGAAAPVFLFSYFTGNGEDGLHFAESSDGLTWTTVSFPPGTRHGTAFTVPPAIAAGLRNTQ